MLSLAHLSARNLAQRSRKGFLLDESRRRRVAVSRTLEAHLSAFVEDRRSLRRGSESHGSILASFSPVVGDYAPLKWSSTAAPSARSELATPPSAGARPHNLGRRHAGSLSHIDPSQYRGVLTYRPQARLFSAQSDKTAEDEAKPSKQRPSRTLSTTKVPTPQSAPPDESPLSKLRQTSPKNVFRRGFDLTTTVLRTVVMFLVRLPYNIFYFMTHGDERREKIAGLKEMAREEAHHYWMGTKLLWADMQTARSLLGRTLGGSSLTRRERKQLLRTVSDLFRLVPFSMFILIPFMEFALPFALRIFPNMLPSTFQESLKLEESMKRELKSRIAMTQFFQETLEELAKEQKRKAASRKKEMEEAGLTEDKDAMDEQEHSAADFLAFLEKARSGAMMPPEVIIRYAHFFQDDLTLDNMPRMQLVNLCKYMNIPPYGSDALLRFQLRHRIRVLKEDDQRILWEGINSLTKMELREACQERGMRSTGLSKEAYKRSLQQWLDLSVHKNVPIALLIMSRTFFLQEETLENRSTGEGTNLSGLADAMSGLDKDVLNEVILEVATSEEKLSDPEIRKLKLEVLSQQNELIRQEQEAREAAARKKEAAEKEKTAENFSDALATESGDPAKALDTSLSSTNSDMSVGEETARKDPPTKEPKAISAAEMDALAQLVSDDPVSLERAELERIKAAIKDEATDKDSNQEQSVPEEAQSVPQMAESPDEATLSAEQSDSLAAKTIAAMDDRVAEEAEASTQTDVVESPEEARTDDEAEEDPIVARLKKRVESMVDKIEVQLSDAELTIGDKFHLLDKDKDGILTREEMASVLRQVLRRDISQEEALDIADDIDANHDGLITVEEFLGYLDHHRIISYVEDGRDADLDRMLANQASEEADKKSPDSDNEQK